ncbi:hypothetical protein PHYSODRAFT_526370 [Phytophthora sojae]|uniref:RxLR effector protein n=1 Tax=Phytophthora sojae (strain P6497) TaxID=1094619 RepID=G5A7N8_PHYSP|nr:hypothetical protein PHYSODRAFT_526370 [Phytophthora sojae]EGZ07914.1 hypothetical protein PHYSODRAFT_526370 [Phytophthora sojae]|eukprot:XP_009536086.1 hypothetical protein PHYSODRAFT_526370 [Phytophthora sojae]
MLPYQHTKLLENPQFQKWTTAVTKGYKKNSEAAGRSMASTLASQYGDEALAKMIVEAKNVPSTENIPAKLEEGLTKNRLSQRKTPDALLRDLNFNKFGHISLWRPAIDTGRKYLEGSQADERMYKVLRASYGDDELAMMLTGWRRYLADDVAKRLEEIQHKALLGEGKDAKAMFTILKLNSEGEKRFESPAFSTWTSYVTKQDAQNADKLMLSALKTTYDDGVLAKMFLAAKESADTKVIAGKLEQAQITDC